MSNAKTEFISQLQALGYTARELAHDFVAFDYEITVGRFIGQKVELAFQLNVPFPMNAPGGPHFKPLLLPKTGGGGQHPFGAIHDSAIGPEWEYWSRPFARWNETDKTVKTYMSHIRHLLHTIP
ncbi:hypothetical protein [Daejeonella sp. JGW-45]|uniref:hypothetical protein n=1 Tax=Daejeonella sp. JGW-45 TaxID=3034148 RepID=UPI0023EDDC72|nr:hypothetical protein [Daejeonella sp. JGW-45]